MARLTHWSGWIKCTGLMIWGWAIAFMPSSGAIAQIIPDQSLGAESSTIDRGGATVDGRSVDLIDGGATRGGNVFHSFSTFNIRDGQRVYFANPSGVDRIIGRVTGDTRSNIAGTLGVLGGADLFLLNPNGILFGPNARLDVNGSFLASTADALLFDDTFAFRASNPKAPPLLTLNTPVGLQWGPTAGAIVNRSTVRNSQGEVVGLQVQPRETLSLLGNGLRLDGGHLTASQGWINLGSVAPNSSVQFTSSGPALTLGYDDVQTFQDISLVQRATVDASGEGGGSVNLQGRHILLTQGSSILADTLGSLNGRGITINTETLSVRDDAFISTSTFGAGMGGDLTIHASDSVRLIGQGFEDFQTLYVIGSLGGTLKPLDRENGLFVSTAGTGDAGHITIDTPELRLREGGSIIGYVFNQGRGAALTVNASDIELTGASVIIATTRGSVGDAGSVKVQTERLTIQDGAFIVTGTISEGNGGPITINASDFVLVRRTPNSALFATSIGTVSFAGATGRGGDLVVNTRRLMVRDGSAIGTSSGEDSRVDEQGTGGGPSGSLTINATDSVEVSGTTEDEVYRSRLISETFTRSPAGEVVVNTRHLVVQGGGLVSAATLNNGPGGRVSVNASESIELIGTSASGLPSGLFASSNSTVLRIASGAGGNLQVITGTLSVRDGAAVSVDSRSGTGDAGNLRILADSIRLNNRGQIIAATASGQGGDINLNVRNLLLLRNQSGISAQAGGTGNGGNIDINAAFIAAGTAENSDIIANAVGGNGGNIAITTQGIFGLANRDRLTPLSDISASSEFGLDGQVEITTPEADPSQDLVALPSSVIDVSNLIAQGCSTDRNAIARNLGEFTITGRGGLPPSPTEPLGGESLFIDWEPLEAASARLSQTTATAYSPTPSTPLSEAQGWQVDADGEVVLTTQATSATPHAPGIGAATCSALGG